MKLMYWAYAVGMDSLGREVFSLNSSGHLVLKDVTDYGKGIIEVSDNLLFKCQAERPDVTSVVIKNFNTVPWIDS